MLVKVSVSIDQLIFSLGKKKSKVHIGVNLPWVVSW
uniref:Uncharacterized protein n=1 Tax=Arundo donax TaxID=35708 RepID=A0A0A9A4A1_ARUDO